MQPTIFKSGTLLERTMPLLPSDDETAMQSGADKRRANLHPDVLKLGLVSFLTDLSSEMIFSAFAVFVSTVAGASRALLGVLEGLADLSGASLNYWGGWWSSLGVARGGWAVIARA